MKKTDFFYDLPSELIAQNPLDRRTASRLMHVLSGSREFEEFRFEQINKLLRPDDLLVLNNTRVIPARLFGRKMSGARVEMLLERIIEPCLALVQLRANRSPSIGSKIIFEPDIQAKIESRKDRFYQLRFESDLETILENYGDIPLPPYIKRPNNFQDRERYQTVYANEPGAVAAPTAGLHFDNNLLKKLTNLGVRQAKITLHVAAGTFLPIDECQLESGKLHSERIFVDGAVCKKVEETRKRGGRVIAVGTTVVRALESASVNGNLKPFFGETDIFIRPGSKFNVVDAMITNFHLPESSLLMLVSAFSGIDTILAAYQFAVEKKFRFFSYGDAMFLERTK
ncbi:MAG: tRNA preQ1(34) S-adenosylmethionine ribosyltransferase-isomerase QueA [Pseudomonadota bacterium]|nr:tRNA preQ1(34) S-adenosylmethionine ribosyltransferase-isomerase QueA [Pseudomonadota bacterium]